MNLQNAFAKRTSSVIAKQMQRARQGAHSPVPKSYFHIPKPADILRSQQIKAGTLGPKKSEATAAVTGVASIARTVEEKAMVQMYQDPKQGAIEVGL